MYHGLAEVSGDPRRSVIAPLGVKVFRAQMRHLRRTYQVVSLDGLRDVMERRRPGDPFPVALTFDDDLESHAKFAAPILSELELPATFFLTGSSLDGPHPFYWHDLDDLYARGGTGWQEFCREVKQRWRAAGEHCDLHLVARTMSMMQPRERDLLALRLREILGTPPSDRGLLEGDVNALADGGFEIGFHTRGHYWLQVLDDETLHDQMRGAERLSAIVGRPLRAIAYPYGPGDLRIASAAADAGFELGVVWTNTALAGPGHSLLLDRVDGAWPSAAEFAFRMARFASAGA